MSLPPTDPAVARRRRITTWLAVLIGAGFIAATLRLPRGSGAFYAAGVALAAVWIVAALVTGPIRLWGSAMSRRAQIGLGLAGGVVMFGVFLAGEAIGRRISVLAGPIDNVLGKADAGPVPAVLTLALVNGVAEELFFRGSLVEVSSQRAPFVISTLVYVGVTAVAGNTALTVAAVVMGIVLALERRITRGLVAPIVNHLVWSTLIILFLPR